MNQGQNGGYLARGLQRQLMFGGPREERQRLAFGPLPEAGAIVRGQGMAALAPGNLQVTECFMARGDRKALGRAECAVLNAGHVVIARHLDSGHIQKARGEGQRA